jgi:hypothetical protein
MIYFQNFSNILGFHPNVNNQIFFRPTPDGSRQVVYPAGKTIAFCKFIELKQWQHQS